MRAKTLGDSKQRDSKQKGGKTKVGRTDANEFDMISACDIISNLWAVTTKKMHNQNEAYIKQAITK